MDTSSAKQDEVDNGRAEGAQRLSSAAGRLPEPGIDLEYNETGLTKEISRNGSTLAEISYLAEGARLSAVGSDGTGVRYLGSLIYSRASDGTLSLDCALTPGGRIVRIAGAGTSGSYQVQHFLRDHLGLFLGYIPRCFATAPWGMAASTAFQRVSPWLDNSLARCDTALTRLRPGHPVQRLRRPSPRPAHRPLARPRPSRGEVLRPLPVRLLRRRPGQPRRPGRQ